MSEVCRLVHEKLAQLPLVKSPFDADKLPFTGIYFFYESGEVWGHGSKHDRIVRTGSSKPGNLRSRIKEHYLLDERKMDFDRGAPKPSDRSIFRKNIGRALLNRDGDDYLRLWDVDFTTRKNRDQFAHLRDMDKERALEAEITRILRCRFSFRFITMEGEAVTMGRKGLEGFIIGTLGSCRLCAPSDDWLGKYSPKAKIAASGFWQEQHLGDDPMNEVAKTALLSAIVRTGQTWATAPRRSQE